MLMNTKQSLVNAKSERRIDMALNWLAYRNEELENEVPRNAVYPCQCYKDSEEKQKQYRTDELSHGAFDRLRKDNLRMQTG